MTEENYLNSFIKGMKEKGQIGSAKERQAIWYNKEGDCLEFQTIDELFIAHRIDKYLTLYRTVENDQLIGFQIKGVKALIRKYCFDAMVVGAGVQDKRVVSIIALLVNVLSLEDHPSIQRKKGYADALRTAPRGEAEKVEVPV